MNAIAIPLNAHPNPDPATLIADFGHPNWPGWWIIMGLLIAAQCALIFQSPDLSQLRPQPSRPGVSRTVRSPRSPSARSARKDKTANG